MGLAALNVPHGRRANPTSIQSLARTHRARVRSQQEIGDWWMIYRAGMNRDQFWLTEARFRRICRRYARQAARRWSARSSIEDITPDPCRTRSVCRWLRGLEPQGVPKMKPRSFAIEPAYWVQKLYSAKNMAAVSTASTCCASRFVHGV